MAREAVFQFLYQCEMEKIYFFSESHFQSFAQHTQIPDSIKSSVRSLAEQVLSRLTYWDGLVEPNLLQWSLDRLATVERCILRLAAAELDANQTPKKVVLNEAIELSKRFGTAESHKIVNGILNRLASDKPAPKI
jgi:N utilization substance protein B